MRGEDRPKRHRLAPQSGVAARLMERRCCGIRSSCEAISGTPSLEKWHEGTASDLR